MKRNELFLTIKSIFSKHKRTCLFLSAVIFTALHLCTSSAFAAVSPAPAQEDAGSTTWQSRVAQFLKGEPPQKIETPSETQQNEVKVVASRLSNYQIAADKIPANTSFKSRQDLELTHPSTFQESVEDLEGVVMYDAVGNGLDTTFSLRGFTDSSDVVVLLDGVRVNEMDGNVVAYPLLDMADMESVQIDRGSASPVYGSGAFAGVVHLTSGQPSEKPFSLFGGTEWSSFGSIQFHNGISGTLQDKWTPLAGKFRYYFKANRSMGEGYREGSDFRITSFDIKSSYEIADELLKIYFGLKHVEDSIANPGELTFDQFQEDDKRNNKPLDGRQFDNTIVQLGFDSKFWEKRIKASLMTYWRFNDIDFYTTSGTFIDFSTGADPNTDRVATDSRSRSLIWQLAYDDQWGWLGNGSLIGMEIQHGHETDIRQEAFQGMVDWSIPPHSERVAQTSSTGLFARQSFTLFEKIIPFVGVRYDEYNLETEDLLSPVSSLDKEWTNASWSTGVTLKPFNWMDLFGNYSQGFRVPTISELAPFASGINTGLQPEQTDSYEAGTRLRYKNKAEAKFSFFLIDLQDEIVFDSSSITPSTPFGRNINIGKSRRTGTETSLRLKPIKELELYGTHTWTLAFVRETDSGGSLVDGRTIGQVPEQRFTLGGNARPLKRLGEPFDGLRVGVNGIFTGRQHPTSYESTSQSTLDATGGAGHTIKPYSIWNFLLSYEWRNKEVYFKINNLFDEKYYSRAISATSFGTSIYPFGTYNFVTPGAGREFLVGAKWKFE